MAPIKSENLGIAFALVTGAGLSTALGAAVVFFPTLVKMASRKTLASALGVSSGVMTYVSFVEIFGKSALSFEDSGIDKDKAFIYATLCFFAGVVFMVTLNHVVSWLLGGHHHHHHNVDFSQGDRQTAEATSSQQTRDSPAQGTTEVPAASLQDIQNMAEDIRSKEEEGESWDGVEVSAGQAASEGCSEEVRERQSDDGILPNNHRDTDQHKLKLTQMSVNTAVAICLHNFPEGLATFVATLSDPGVGYVLAAAIAIHNIPEGLCVAMPIYYATGNRWKAFGWALLSGIAEPLAAICGWLFLARSFGDKLYAILFGMVAGMMVIICVRELLPTAHRYDPHDSVVTNSFIFGMGAIALSLVLFVL